MKTRNGFVSNSSSSSFIIGVKNATLHEALKELESKELKSGGLFSGLVLLAIETLENNSNEFNDHYVRDEYDIETIEKFLEEEAKYGGSDATNIRTLIDGGFEVHVGRLSDDGGEPVEAMLCNMDLNYKTKNFVLIHEGGY